MVAERVFMRERKQGSALHKHQLCFCLVEALLCLRFSLELGFQLAPFRKSQLYFLLKAIAYNWTFVNEQGRMSVFRALNILPGTGNEIS